jgi:uncharacterized protein YcbX
MIKVTGLFIYPVKSLGGISVNQAQLGKRGFLYDREWQIVDRNNRFVSQREIAKMALIHTNIDEAKNVLTLSLPKTDEAKSGTVKPPGDSDEHFKLLNIPLAQRAGAEEISVTVWDDSAQATVESAEVNESLSKFLGADLRLMRMTPAYRRQVDEAYAPGENNIVGFADGFPLLIIGEESLDDLNDRLEYPILMNRFRPNITTSGGGAFGEDTWGKIKIRDVELSLVKPCARCVITTVDQESGVQGKEPLRTLANYRKKDGKILFGQNAVFDHPGKVEIGDTVLVN